MSRAEREWRREDFRHFQTVPTRWRDNDSYGHVNNAVYYTFMEMAVMHYIEVEAALDLPSMGVRCFSVENGCRYHSALAYPETVEIGLRVARIGRSSVRYELGLFAAGDPVVRATGHVVDVFVDADETPVEIPVPVRAAFATIESPS